ncbi:isoamylase early set domain-containing protein [Alteromonas lipolytica]|uniref:Glycoside hydrolase n=1 Tax=Alteromonas lipolytica TaxID=1856405 RepID=A0A1E8FIW4_9ALTE|nr:isoamylase early set domain-containing protein [Alteromonas lipolytica]OFI35870.1 glycoside hydrolase [Alteromonas lipolytica]GGF81524.1 1,4-alpha-glucan-branching protein [Alteromonas lipolytica]
MSLKKQYLKSKPVCKVTFKLTASEANNAETAKLVGDFNEWDIAAEPMKKLKNGDFTQTLNLTADCEYQFRYLLDDENWENDWAADAYKPSPISFDDNSVVRV